MILANLPASISHRDRQYLFCRARSPLFRAVLSIRQGKTRDVYAVEEQPAELGGTGFRRWYVAKCGGKADEGIYCVTVSPDGAHCTCGGFGRWGNCKHADAFADLVQRGTMPPDRYADAPGFHRHLCEWCDTVWAHADATKELCVSERHRAHRCPKCSREEWYIFRGNTPPVSVCHHADESPQPQPREDCPL